MDFERGADAPVAAAGTVDVRFVAGFGLGAWVGGGVPEEGGGDPVGPSFSGVGAGGGAGRFAGFLPEFCGHRGGVGAPFYHGGGGGPAPHAVRGDGVPGGLSPGGTARGGGRGPHEQLGTLRADGGPPGVASGDSDLQTVGGPRHGRSHAEDPGAAGVEDGADRGGPSLGGGAPAARSAAPAGGGFRV